jgi:uncharacterized protein (TIGR03083 family)
MDVAGLYTASATRLLDLAPTLDDARQATLLPATPPWTVVDAYRHLLGVAADVLDGNTEGAGSPPWTAAQLARTADCSLAEVCERWRERLPGVVELTTAGGPATGFLAFDVWTHEQDVRVATGAGAAADDEVAADLAALALSSLAGRYASSGAPTVRVAFAGGGGGQLGEGEPELTLATTPFELLRMIFGRRSEAQLAAAGWSGAGDASAAAAALHLLDCPVADIAD